LLKYVHEKYPDIIEGIKSSKALSKENEQTLATACKEFAASFK